MSEHKIPIPSMLYNAAVGGHVTNSQQIIDENLNREQNDINQEIVGAVPYNSTTPNGMGRIVLKKNDNFKQVVESQTNGNTIFIIKYDFTLTGNVTIPANSILEFDGGSISGEHTLTGNNTSIKAEPVKIFNTSIIFPGTWNVDVAYVEWYGAKADGVMDCTDALNKVAGMFGWGTTVQLLRGTYCVTGLDFSDRQYVTLLGHSDSLCREDQTYANKRVSSSIRLTQNSNYIIQTEKLVDGTWHRAKSITIKNVGLDGANLAQTGFVCTFGTFLYNTHVERCIGNGVETGYSAYPTHMEKCMFAHNGGHGFLGGTANSSQTTCYWFKDCEFYDNTGYGIVIEQGVNIKLTNCLIQSNKRGGAKIRKTSNTRWLAFITFDNLYTEANGTLNVNDVNYEGNYQVITEGFNTDFSTAVGKLEGLIFVNCNIQGDTKIEGTTDPRIFGIYPDIRTISPYTNRFGLGKCIYRVLKNSPLYIDEYYVQDSNDCPFDYSMDCGVVTMHVRFRYEKTGIDPNASEEKKLKGFPLPNKRTHPSNITRRQYIKYVFQNLVTYDISEGTGSFETINGELCFKLGKTGEQLPQRGVIEFDTSFIVE